MFLDVVHTLETKLANLSCTIEVIRFDFLVPTKSLFEVGFIRGRLAGWKNLDGSDWGIDSKSYGSNGSIVIVDVNKTTTVDG